MSYEMKYVRGEPLYDEISGKFAEVRKGDKITDENSSKVYTVNSAYFDCGEMRFCVEEKYGWIGAQHYYRAIPVEEKFEWVFENAECTPLRDLPTEELKAVVDAFETTDYVVETLTPGGWLQVMMPYLATPTCYRVKRKIVDTPLDIPWKHINRRWKWAAMDKSGSVYLYENKPSVGETYYKWACVSCDRHFNIQTDGIDWKRSLTKRPEGM